MLYRSIFPQSKKTLFWISFVGFFLTFTVISTINVPLSNSTASAGIVSFEFSWTSERAAAIVNSWNPKLQRLAGFSLGFDYLFMLFYAIPLSLACLWVGTTLSDLSSTFSRLAGTFSGCVWLAALLDAVENVGLSSILLFNSGSPWPAISSMAALGKFTLLCFGLIYFFAGSTIYLIKHFQASTARA